MQQDKHRINKSQEVDRYHFFFVCESNRVQIEQHQATQTEGVSMNGSLRGFLFY